MTQPSTVHVELHGLQRFLFASQRLKAMRGGEALLHKLFKDIDSNVELRGGHVEFDTCDPAGFISSVQRTLSRNAPGIGASFSINGARLDPAYLHHYATALAPIVQPCVQLAREAAIQSLSYENLAGGVSEAPQALCRSMLRRRELGKDETTISAYAQRGYFALVKLDGNAFGVIAQRPDRKKIFANLYQIVDQAQQAALAAIELTPAQCVKLMGGGDDLVFLMPPDKALPFVEQFACAFRLLTESNTEPVLKALSFAAGVVIAKDLHIPAMRSHHSEP